MEEAFSVEICKIDLANPKREREREREERKEGAIVSLAMSPTMVIVSRAGFSLGGRRTSVLTRGRKARLEVSCRTAFEKRIEAKKNQAKTGVKSAQIDLGKQKGKDIKSNNARSNRRKDWRAESKLSTKVGSSKNVPNEKAGSADQSARKPKTVSKEQEQNVSKPKVTSADASAKASAQKAAAVSSKKPKKARGLRFERDFGFGEQGAHVEKLQRILLGEKYLTSRDQITGYFGRETKEALTSWQKANRVMPSGYFGPVSRALINKQGNLTKMRQSFSVACQVNQAGTAVAGVGVIAGVMALTVVNIGWIQKFKNVVKEGVAMSVSFLKNRQTSAELYEEEEYTPKPKMVVRQRTPRLGQGQEASGREEYSRRVELRREIAGLQNALGYTEDQLNNAKRQLKREKERADRAESLYLQQKAENQKLQSILRTKK